jgi:hypothetical protein
LARQSLFGTCQAFVTYGQELLEAEAEEIAASIAAGLGNSNSFTMQQIQVRTTINFDEN